MALRHRLAEDINIQVFEVLPSLINTESAKEIRGEQNGLPPSVVADGLIQGLENDHSKFILEKHYYKELRIWRTLERPFWNSIKDCNFGVICFSVVVVTI